MTKSFPSSLALCRWTGNGAPLERCEVKQLLEITHDPKNLELEETDNGLVGLRSTLTKLSQVTKLDFFLNTNEARTLAAALIH